ncbi:glyoxalase superfamily protein [Pseudomonas aeruginosa]|uniref:glyoxalase superfamily protein n=1 Tax=Pseudomonas aeruginosa TaxID=287 RepID=UPI0003D3588C|nr:glyoxalase superfamily protein [Pseudomonas aeruginosa]ELT7041602.1 hypothetical protein [Pseudomonas aeruginosa]ETD50439.1 hypothetical protein X778_19150 [Pseudomonas aeruginosa VRFPA07]KAA5588710.1 hypothetical protein F3H14_25810 [Pseudomonas aeruginosa]MBG6418853.1 hypothetical protein [Pseudomonas aeruginosa]MBH8811638.1 hypothetical protein [Pseudomonas aeruginosa]
MQTIESLKSQAKRLRTHFSAQNIELSHSQTLEAIAAIHGFKDWNTASALSPKKIKYPTTDESVEQLRERFNDMARAYATKPEGSPLSDEEKTEVKILLHQLGVAAKRQQTLS